MRHFADFWANTGWKMAYAAIVVVAITMLIVMFS